MNAPPSSGDDLRESLRKVQRGVWGILALCAVVSFTQEATEPEPPPDPEATTAAIALAFLAVVARIVGDSPRAGVRLRVISAILSWTAAAAIGFVGVWVAMEHGAVRMGIALPAGALFLALRGLPRFPEEPA